MKKGPAKKAPTKSHAVLGRVTFEDAYEWWKASVEIQPGKRIDFYLSTWGTHQLSPHDLLDQGALFLAWAQQSERLILNLIADNLLSVYHENWSPEESRGGKPMSRGAFLNHITSSSINVNADGSAYWYFKDGGLFAGHSIEVRVQPDRTVAVAGLAG